MKWKKSDIYNFETALWSVSNNTCKDYDDALKSGIGKLVADNISDIYCSSNNPSIGTVSKIYAENRRIG